MAEQTELCRKKRHCLENYSRMSAKEENRISFDDIVKKILRINSSRQNTGKWRQKIAG